MTNIMYDKKLAESRLDAYIDMIVRADGLTEDQLADRLGVPHQTWTKFRRAEWGKKSSAIVFALARVTGVNASWLYAEQG